MSGNLRVAIVSAGELYGGVERFISTFAAHLAEERKAEAVVFLFSNGELARALRAMGVAVQVSPHAFKFDPRQVAWLSRCFAAEGIDVAHAHGYKASVIVAFAARRAGIPAVKTEHGALEPFGAVARVKMKAYLALDRCLTERRFDEVVYITSDLMRHRLWSGRRGARVIPNGIAPMPEGTPGGFGDGKFHVGIVGRLSPVKGHAVLFDAVARSARRRDIRLHVFGDGPLKEQLASAAAAADLDAVFHGFRPDVLDQMSRLDCLAMPSFNEGLPYTLLEAMHLGVPVVASNVGGMREILEDDSTALLVEPGNAAALAAALDRLVGDAVLRRRLGSAARRRAIEAYGIAPMADSYMNLYREVVRA